MTSSSPSYKCRNSRTGRISISRGPVSKTFRFDTPTEVIPATASSGLAAVSSCISKSMSHKLVDSLDFETRTSEADLPGEHLGEQAPAA